MAIINKITKSFALVIIFISIISFFVFGGENTVNKIQYVKIAGQNIKVDLALTPEEQMQGLSGRSGLKENEGMLFIFDAPAQHSFWMKDMNFAIDIIWLSENKKVVYIKKDARPESYLSAGKAGPEIFGPNERAKYVLEVVSGFSEKNNLKEGDRVKFIY